MSKVPMDPSVAARIRDLHRGVKDLRTGVKATRPDPRFQSGGSPPPPPTPHVHISLTIEWQFLLPHWSDSSSAFRVDGSYTQSWVDPDIPGDLMEFDAEMRLRDDGTGDLKFTYPDGTHDDPTYSGSKFLPDDYSALNYGWVPWHVNSQEFNPLGVGLKNYGLFNTEAELAGSLDTFDSSETLDNWVPVASENHDSDPEALALDRHEFTDRYGWRVKSWVPVDGSVEYYRLGLVTLNSHPYGGTPFSLRMIPDAPTVSGVALDADMKKWPREVYGVQKWVFDLPTDDGLRQHSGGWWVDFAYEDPSTGVWHANHTSAWVFVGVELNRTTTT